MAIYFGQQDQGPESGPSRAFRQGISALPLRPAGRYSRGRTPPVSAPSCRSRPCRSAGCPPAAPHGSARPVPAVRQHRRSRSSRRDGWRDRRKPWRRWAAPGIGCRSCIRPCRPGPGCGRACRWAPLRMEPPAQQQAPPAGWRTDHRPGWRKPCRPAIRGWQVVACAHHTRARTRVNKRQSCAGADSEPGSGDTATCCGEHATDTKINSLKNFSFLVGYFLPSAFIFFHLPFILCSISPIFGDISTNQLMVGKNIR